MSEGPKEHRLPPPAFPPGQRRRVVHRPEPEAADLAPADSNGMISPDDPLPGRLDPIEAAFISPDEPIPERRIELAPDFIDAVPPTEADLEGDSEGEVVGMDLDAEAEVMELLAVEDPHVAEVAHALANLAEALERRGEAGLRAAPDMSRFEATLRSYCVGYIAGRRSEEPPAPVEEY